MTGALRSRLVQASVTSAFAVIILALRYLGKRGQPFARNFLLKRLRIALPALRHVAAARGYFAEGLDVSIPPVNHGVAAIDEVLPGKVDLVVAAEVPFVISVTKGDAFGMVASVSNDNAIIARPDDAIHGYSLRANSYVRKPVDFAEFLEAVRILGVFWLMTNHPTPERHIA